VKPLVFLGGGRITSALVAGLRRSGYEGPIVVHDHHAKKLSQLKRQFGVTPERDPRRALASAGLLVVAVRPGSVAGLLQGIGPVRKPLTAVSLAAGIPLANLRSLFGGPVRWARAMPSPVCRSARGLTALSFERGFPAKARAEVRRLFLRVGTVLEIREKQFDAFTVTYSSSHGYHALATLAGAAQQLGLDRGSALTAAAHALEDGIRHWRESGIALARLLHEAATPGGVAAATMNAMDAAGYSRVVERGVRAGVARARANAKD
jgi:pyrroline-5-carboxylate reductase